MLWTSISLVLCLKLLNTFTFKSISIRRVLPLSIICILFVVFTNLSLEYNTLGTSQLFKILTTPFVTFISWYYYKTHYSRLLLITLIPLSIGIPTHSINDIKLTIAGTIVAILGSLTASLYQIWIDEKQKEFDMDSQQLLVYQVPLSAIVLLPFVLIIEKLSFFTSSMPLNSMIVISLSGFLVFIVNISLCWVIKNTSPLTYNIIGHIRT
ncbi:unnamed protein product, partial [Didymodactylos carnosus]